MSARDNEFMKAIVLAHFGAARVLPPTAVACIDSGAPPLDRMAVIAGLLRLALDPADPTDPFDRVRQALDIAEAKS